MDRMSRTRSLEQFLPARVAAIAIILAAASCDQRANQSDDDEEAAPPAPVSAAPAFEPPPMVDAGYFQIYETQDASDAAHSVEFVRAGGGKAFRSQQAIFDMHDLQYWLAQYYLDARHNSQVQMVLQQERVKPFHEWLDGLEGEGGRRPVVFIEGKPTGLQVHATRERGWTIYLTGFQTPEEASAVANRIMRAGGKPTTRPATGPAPASSRPAGAARGG